MKKPSYRTSKPSSARLALVELLLQEEGIADSTPLAKIARRMATTPCPLSFAQERLWFIDQLEPHSSLYNMPVAVRLSGSLDIAALQQSLTEIVRRHEVLRTTFSIVDGWPAQVLGPTQSVLLRLLDLQGLSEHEHAIEAEALRLAAQEAHHPFDLAAGSLLRATLLRLSKHDYVVLLTMHHIVSDEWSIGVLIREISVLYSAFIARQPTPLPELPIQYADYAIWQRDWLQGDLLQAQRTYWKDQLGDLPILQLPTDYLRPPVPSFRGARFGFVLSTELSQALVALGHCAGVTLFMLLAAAWQVLLARYSHQDDIAVGTPIANRSQAETEPLIGFFVNTLILRTNLSSKQTFHEVLGNVRKVALEAYAHQDIPFEQVVEALGPERDLSRHPLVQVMFTLQNTPISPLELPGLTLRPLAVEHRMAKFDLSLWLAEAERQLVGMLEYCSDLFESTTITRMVGHFQTLLAGIVAQPAQHLAGLPILTRAESQQLLLEFNATAADYPRDHCIHQLFEAQVCRTPDHIALVFADQHLTFAELNARANQLAHHLQHCGVGPNVLVAICLERSPKLVIGVLGILKAGGAYIPLDPTYPRERLAFMLADSHAAVLVTRQQLSAVLPASEASPICLDTDGESIRHASAANLTSGVTPGHLAYVIYTSGSTGRPKGVMVEHGSLVNTLCASQARYRFTADDRIPSLLSFSFDIALFQLLSPLLVGGTAILIPEQQVLDLPCIATRLHELTFLHGPPSLLRSIVDFIRTAAPPSQYGCIRQVAVGGDTIPPVLIHDLQQVFAAAQLYIGYGPTEGTIMCTNYSVPRDAIPCRHVIGRPLQNMQVRLHDGDQNLVPIGVPGELYIGGAGVAHGYLQRIDLTNEKFVSIDGQRWYKSGDLARWLPNGNLEFLGRIDRQVKLRGFRIELAEIEVLLGQHPEVRECVVMARKDSYEEKRLVAYVVPTTNERPPTTDHRPPANEESATSSFVLRPSSLMGELRAFLKEHLPEYMVPSAFVLLKALPLTPNGKVNHNALPTPDTARPIPDHSFVAPYTLVEEILAQIWAGILHLEQVGINDNFFALGGHSLLATQIISRIRDAFGVEIPLRNLFEGPTIVGLAKQIEARRREGTGAQVLPLRPAPRDQPPPLSFAQQRLWFLDQLQPNSPVYNLPSAVRLMGQLDLAILQQSLSAIVRRHEVLRTTFVTVDDQPVQAIAPTITMPLPLIDLQRLPADEREEMARRLAAAQAACPFDLARGPLLRVALLRLDHEDHVALLTMHHIISDGWSMSVLVREIGAIYSALMSAQPSRLPELPVQYADYAIWQRQWLQGAVLEEQLAYWRTQLAGLSALNLPTDRPRPPIPSFRGTSEAFMLSPKLSADLLALSRTEGVTLFMTLLVAFQTLLARYSGQTDIVVGVPIANRTRAEIEPLIGFFINTLVLRNDLSGTRAVRDVLRQVRTVTLDAYAHQDLPFEQVVEALQPVRDLSRHPLFQVMFVLQNVPSEKLELPNLTLQPLTTQSMTTKFDLSLSCMETEACLVGTLEYCIDLFETTTIIRLLQHFQVLLEGIVVHPEQQLTDLPLLTDAERQQLLTEWNATTANYPHDKCLHQLFEAQEVQTPDGVAVVFEDEHLTYRELNARANRLAHYLRTLGVEPDVLVGLCMERSFAMLVGILGILKAGGAYVPLDPSNPPDRLAFMLEDAQVSVLLTRQHLATRIPAQGIKRICLDADWDGIAQHSPQSPYVEMSSANLAYLIYTSGSTGRPKAVMVEHRQVINTLCASRQQFQFQPQDVMPWIAPVAFDITLFELLNPLLVGGTVVILSPEHVLDLACLVNDLTQVTLFHAVPSLMRQIVQEIISHRSDFQRYDRIRTVFIGGDSVPPDLLIELQALFRRAQIRVLYGPTEGTIICTQYTVSADATVNGYPIGMPLGNVQIRLYDRQRCLVPIGVAGEIYLGGPGVTRGYLHQEALTDEHYVILDEQRWYRTGDLARYQPDGNLIFLGRLDGQVKVRGFRIELGEIETVLRQHPAVRECVLVQGIPGEQRLVAYVIPRTILHPTLSELRGFLQVHLPDYMVPATFVMLEALPLTSSGKIDRRALPMPETNRPALDSAFIAPRTPVEEMLANIWADVLRLERIGIHDNFFALGGHSLLATQVISRVRDSFVVDVPLRYLFEAPTIASLVERIIAAQYEGAEPDTPPLVPRARNGQLPLSFGQQRLWFLDQLQPGSSLYNMPIALRLKGQLNIIAFRKSLTEIVRRHEVLRTTFPATNGQPVQMIAPAEVVQFPLLDLQAVPAQAMEAEAHQLGAEEARRLFDLARGPLFRAALLRLGKHDHAVLLTMHHIVSDGWSMDVLIREVASLYEAYAAGHAHTLPALPIQYADFALWQRHWLQGTVLAKQLAYWQHYLAGVPPLLELPTDRPRPAMQTVQGAVATMPLNGRLSAALYGLSQQIGSTLFMTLLAAFQVLLHRYSGQADLVVGTPIANRTRQEVEGQIGFFVNTLVIRGQFRANPTFREVLRQVREGCLGAYAHQDLPFEMLVDVLKLPRELSHTPLFQVMFVLQNAPREALRLPGLEVEPLPVASGTAKFDLTLAVTETAEGLITTAEYNTDQFEATTIMRLLGHWKRVLEDVVAEPEIRIGAIGLLREEERQQLLVEWNATMLEYPREQCLHELFEAQVAWTPDAVAVVFEDESLTYAELNTRANQLACYLRTLGVKPEMCVGLCIKRSPELIVGLLGILKAGGVYVPLDHTYPWERLAFMLVDAQMQVLLTQQRLLEKLPEHSAKVVCLDSDWESIASASRENPVTNVMPLNLAYVIYTSGSTGQPKGVAITHQSAVAFLAWTHRCFDRTQLAGMLAATSICFDLSIFELFVPLSAGGTIMLAENVLDLPTLPAASAVTLINTIPSAMVELVRLHGLPTTICTVNLAGEALPLSLVGQLYQQPTIQQIYNLYGPSEATTYSTYALIVRGADTPPPIGRPIANTQIYLLDTYLQPVPLGVLGEVYIGGAGLARSYLNRPELIAERFVPNPFAEVSGIGGQGSGVRGQESGVRSQKTNDEAHHLVTLSPCHLVTQTGERLYRTGDRARYRADGSIEFLGRLDKQVKVRGFRIELGEIEAILGQHPAVREAVVLAREDFPGDKRLVAYVVPQKETIPSVRELRIFLKQKLPTYMVPTAFVILEMVPLTPNKKVDRHALPAPDITQPDLQGSYIAPRDTLEFQLVQIWEDILGVHPIGVTNNFFDLGGHSLLATGLMAQIRQQFDRDLPLSILFSSPTIEHLAFMLRQHTDSLPWSPVVPIQSGGSRPPFFCIHPLGGQVLCYSDLARYLGADQPFYGLQVRGLYNEQEPYTCLEDMASHYVEAIRMIQPLGPYFLGGWSAGGIVAFEMAQQLRQHGQAVALLAMLDAWAPIPRSEADPLPDIKIEPSDEATMLVEIVGKENLPMSYDAFMQLEPDERVNCVVELGRRANVIPLGTGALEIRRFLKIRSANGLALARYVPYIYPDRITLFKAESLLEDMVPPEIMPTLQAAGITMGWGALSTQPVTIVTVPGTHESLVNEPHVRILAERLRSCIDAFCLMDTSLIV